MPTPKKGARLGGSSGHQKHILSNLAQSLFEHGAIKTTEAKAKMLRPMVATPAPSSWKTALVTTHQWSRFPS